MKVTCTQENLNKALIGSARIISLKSSLPILDNVLLSTDQGRLKISATDLELGINCWIGAKIEGDGAVAVPSRLLTDFVSNIKEEKVSLLSSGTDVSVEGEKYSAVVKGVSAEDFPTIPDISKEQIFSVSSKVLASAIPQVVFAAATDSTRPVLSGVLFKFEKDSLKIVATDSYRLSEKTVKITKKPKQVDNFIVPARTIIEVGKLAKDAAEKIEVCFDGNQVLFNFGSVHLISRLIDGQYPNYEQIIPLDSESKIIIEKEEFFNVCKVASLFARESANSIRVSVKPHKNKEGQGTLSIVGQGSQIGESTSKVPVKMEGKEIEISFNAKYILDVLSNIEDKNIEMSFGGKINPGTIKGEGKHDYLYVIMPLRS